MSKLFFDHLLDLDEIDRKIKTIAKTKDEAEELWKIVDEIVHHKVLGCIFAKLPRQDHEEFLFMMHSSPHESALFDYLKKKIGNNIEEIIKEELGTLAYEILEEIKTPSTLSSNSNKR